MNEKDLVDLAWVGSWSLASLRDIGHALYPNLAIDQSNVLISNEFSREGTIEGSRLTPALVTT